MPVGVPIDLARKYPRENAGVSCFVPDVNLRERQEKYARLYNEKIYSYITHHSS
jgi:hypothetical protein